ncbi:MAG: nicotinate (nicotinamide) nucleotide adenylyltransferase [Nitrospiraceae bacterium]|nr:nicotinate (nicotinamide) nucleotide adenylyltransferase [Nitrospiraceae bacterium]
MMSPDSESQPSAPSTQQSCPLRLGLLGGSFNPVHNGHLAIARQTREALGLDQILFIPTSHPPHKPNGSLAPAQDRYEMVRLAIDSEPASAISDVEIRRPGKSYSIDTVRLLQQEYGAQTQLFFLIGLDAFLDFPSWREPQTLLELCRFVILSRPGLSFRSLSTVARLPPIPYPSLADLDADRISRIEAPIGTQGLICLKLPPCAISASDIRARIRQGLSAANLLPPVVESYILHHHLYQRGP